MDCCGILEGLGGELTGGDTLDATTAGETADGRLGDALNVVTEDFAMAFGAAFAKTFTTFSACVEGEG